MHKSLWKGNFDVGFMESFVQNGGELVDDTAGFNVMLTKTPYPK